AGQIHDLALRRHRIDAIGEQLLLEPLEHVALQWRGLSRVEYTAHPLDLALVAGIARTARGAFLVAPVRGDAELGVLVHLARANLHFHGFVRRADHRRVTGAI